MLVSAHLKMVRPDTSRHSRSLLSIAVTVTVAASSCGRSCGPAEPPEPTPATITAPDGREYVLLALGPHTPFYDEAGALDRIEYDRNGDGEPDQVARHAGARLPRLVENDDDFDGEADHWVHYDVEGRLEKVGVSRSGQPRQDLWHYLGPDGETIRQEFDDDGDGVAERAEELEGGLVVKIAVDADRDGRMDRWQDWREGRLSSEELDTDGDGEPDRRLLYGPDGRVTGLEPVG